MKRHIQFAGICGLVILSFGLITVLLLEGDPFYFTPIHLTLSGVLIAVFIIGGGLQTFQTVAARRATGLGAGMALYSSLFFGLLILINYISYRHDFLHYDSTEQKVYTLAPQTLSVLHSLEHPIVIRVFSLKGEIHPDVHDLLQRIVKISEKIKWKLIDPEKDPAAADKFGINQSPTIHITYQLLSGSRESKISREPISEQEIVDAIQKLTRGGAKTVYYLKGHGEPDLASDLATGFLYLKESIEGENLKVQELVLNGELAATGIPADAAALIIAAPKKHLLNHELEAIDAYLGNAGDALFLSEPNAVDDIAKLVKPFGIEIGNDVIIDQVIRLFAGGLRPMITTYGKHPITKDLKEGIFLSTTSSVRTAHEDNKTLHPENSITELAMTSENSWAETKIAQVFSNDPQVRFDSADIKGPISVAVAFEGYTKPEGQLKEKKGKSRIIVIGDADFVANANIKDLFNRDFLLNSLNWVIGEPEGITLRARTLRQSTKVITPEQFGIIFLITAIVMPEILLIGGFAAWWLRKN